MSRSNPNTAANPATRFFEWKAERGELQYYDKEKKENVSVKLPFSFLILDELSQVGGGTKATGKYEGYWSNAVKNLNTQIITVKAKNGIVAQGFYADLKERKGLHYEKVLYIGFYGDDKELKIGCLTLKGSSLGAWFEFTKAHRNLYAGAFGIKSRSEKIAGEKSDYYTPMFHHISEISEKSEEAAKELDRQLQEYLKGYFALSGAMEEAVEEERVQFAASASAAPAYTGGYVDLAEAPDDDIPF
jgi:hypothetical protein